MTHRGASSGYGRGGVPFLERIYVILEELGRIFANLITKIPVLLGIVLFFVFVVGMSTGLQSLGDFVNNQKKIAELKTVVKHLDKRYRVAQLVVEDLKWSNDSTRLTKLRIDYFNYNENGEQKVSSEKIEIKGNDIYFDALIMNFDYSSIETGGRNLVIPYKIYSDVVAKDKGIILNIKNKDNIPYFYNRDTTEIYGLSADSFVKRTKELMNLINDKEAARALGVRSLYGNSVHRRVWKDWQISIWIEQTGGLILKTDKPISIAK